MKKFDLAKPSHIMLAWAGLTVSSALFYSYTKSGIYLRRRQQALPPPTITKTEEISWEDRIAKDEENAAKKGYKVNYRDIHQTTAEAAAEEAK